MLTPLRAEWRANRRRAALRVTCGVMAALLLTVLGGLPGLIAPWTFLGKWPGHKFPEIHRWHDGQWGAMMALLLAGSLLGVVRRPEARPVLAQFAVAASAMLVLVNVPFDPLILVGLVTGFLVPMAAIAYLYRPRAALLNLQPAGSPNVLLIIVSVATTVVLARIAWRYYDWQWRNLGGEHAKFQHWTITSTLTLTLLAAGLLAATRRPGARWLGIQAGIALLYLGIAAQRVPDHPGSWGTTGGRLAIAAGLAYIGATLAGAVKASPIVVDG